MRDRDVTHALRALNLRLRDHLRDEHGIAADRDGEKTGAVDDARQLVTRRELQDAIGRAMDHCSTGQATGDQAWRLHLRDEHGVDPGDINGGPFLDPARPSCRRVTVGWRVRMTRKVPQMNGCLYDWEAPNGYATGERQKAALFCNQGKAIESCKEWVMNEHGNDEDWSLIEVVRVTRRVSPPKAAP